MTLAHSIDSKHEIFVCYARENRDWVDQLELHKRPASTESATLWIDTDQIYLGDRWTVEAEHALRRATAAVLLVSEHFLGSPAITQRELPIIMERYRLGEMSVVFIPIGEQLDIEQVARTLSLDQVQEVVSVPAWETPLPTVAQPRPAVREMIISAATEPKEIQRLRRNIAPHYELKKRLGDGPFSTVYTAYDHQLERDVAIKLLRDGCSGEHFETAVRRVAKATDHTNILSLYSAYLDANPPHYAFEYVLGHPLHALLHDDRHCQGKPLPVRYVRELLTSIGSAISYAHQRQVSDLNIKPSNIIVTDYNSRPDRNYFLNLNSYSEVGFLDDDGWRSNRDDILYLPPEYRSGTVTWNDSKKADQYRLGIVAYEMLVGSDRFRALAEPLRQRDFSSETWQWPALKTERRDCPQRICDVVDRMVKTDRRDRYDSVDLAVACITITDPDVEAVRESYRRLMDTEESQREFFTRFYSKFLTECPSAKRFFDKRRFGDLHEEGEISKAWQRQFQALKEAVLLLIVFSAFREGEREINILTRIVEAHAQKRVPAGFYPPFGEVLIEVAIEEDRDAPLPEEELRRAWSNVVRPGIEHMMRKTEQIEVGLVPRNGRPAGMRERDRGEEARASLPS